MSRQNYFVRNRTDESINAESLSMQIIESELNSNLLEQIQNYIEEIQANPNSNSALLIYFAGIDENIFAIENNTPNADFLPDSPGVSLTTAPDAIMDDWMRDIFGKSKLFPLFKHKENLENIYINYEFDAESLCAAVQYFAQCYNCPQNDIKIIYSKESPNSESSNSGCTGMLALLLTIGGTLSYGVVQLISNFI